MSRISDFPSLQAKKLSSSWADQMDDIQSMAEQFSRDSITLEEFARLICYLIPKCEVDTTKTSHHFQIDDTFVDLMYRDHVVISVSSRRSKSRSDDEDDNDVEAIEKDKSDKSDEEEEEEAERDAESSEKDKSDNAAPEPAVQMPVDGVVIPPANDGEWTEVIKKKRPRQRDVGDTREFYFFRNEANANYMEFVGIVHGFDRLVQLAKAEILSHAFCLADNLVYDFNDPCRRGDFRYFLPNMAYMSRFQKWFEAFEANGEREPADLRRFYVFKQNSTWPKWTFAAFVEGLPSVRRLLQDGGFEFGHAYCLDTNDLVNFTNRDGRLYQQVSKAPVKYIDRFQVYLQDHDLSRDGNDGR